MSANTQSRSEQKRDEQNHVLRLRQCMVCPLNSRKGTDQTPTSPVDVLIISDWMQVRTMSVVLGVPSYHVFMTECGQKDEEPNLTAEQCCLGRKRDLISQLKPKVVIAVGHSIFSKIEDSVNSGPSTGNEPDYVPFPTTFQRHDFWLIKFPPFVTDFRTNLNKQLNHILDLVKNPAKTERGDIAGIEYVMDNAEIQPAFDYLLTKPELAWDIETTTSKTSKYSMIRPYTPGSRLLSVSISDGLRSFAFPLFHSMTPSNFDANEVLRQMITLFKQVKMIAHNGPFEYEWFVYFFGPMFAYLCKEIGDTMGQAYLLSHGPKSLNYLIRRYFGFQLKLMSSLDVTKLDDYPIDQVLKYNALDAKYTFKLWERQNQDLALAGIDPELCKWQYERTRAVAVIQNKGLVPNLDFAKVETEVWYNKLQIAQAKLAQDPKAQQFHNRMGHTFNAESDTDIANMYHQFLGVPTSRVKFDKGFLGERENCSISKSILDIRHISKVYSTYLVPQTPEAKHQNAGKNVYPDGLIHTIFNTMRVVTGRLSSEDPNMQNWTKKGGLEYIRNQIMAPAGHVILSGDLGQIEYRMIAALSGDAEMIKAINDGTDIHLWWAKRLMEIYPNKFVKETDVACMKEMTTDCPCMDCGTAAFRDICKGLVFGYSFGATDKKIGTVVGISDQRILQGIGGEFWGKHQGVKKWHDSLGFELDNIGYIQNIFGRRYYAPIDHNQMVNYPIQGSAGDMNINAMSRLTKLGVETGETNLIPVNQVHDDLLFYIPEDRLEEYIPPIVSTVLDLKAMPKLPIPLTMELKYGKTWGKMTKIGTFSTTDVN